MKRNFFFFVQKIKKTQKFDGRISKFESNSEFEARNAFYAAISRVDFESRRSRRRSDPLVHLVQSGSATIRIVYVRSGLGSLVHAENV